MSSAIFSLIVCLLVTLFSVIAVALIILVERKFLAAAQRRVGPAILGFRGILQIVADLVKTLYKENFEHIFKINIVRCFCIYCFFATQLIFTGLFEFDCGISLTNDFEFLVIIQTAVVCLSLIFIQLIGFLSSSHYSIFGSVRAVFSEISNAATNSILTMISIETTAGVDWESFNYLQDCYSFSILNIFLTIISVMQLFIDAQRSPVDLIEVEGEIVAGYNTEISAGNVLLIYFSEYFHLFNAAILFVLSNFNNNIILDVYTIFIQMFVNDTVLTSSEFVDNLYFYLFKLKDITNYWNKKPVDYSAWAITTTSGRIWFLF